METTYVARTQDERVFQEYPSFDEAKRVLIRHALTYGTDEVAKSEDEAMEWCFFAEDLNLVAEHDSILRWSAPDGTEFFIDIEN